jgi:mannan endo-1,4-beta-mannosidase
MLTGAVQRSAGGRRGRASRRTLLRNVFGGAAAAALGSVVPGNRSGLAWPIDAAPEGAVAIGAYLPDVLFKHEILTTYADNIRRMPDFLVWYASWADGLFNDEHRRNLQVLDSWGLVPVIAWDPMEHLGPTIDQPQYALSTIIRGEHDVMLESWARGLAEFGKTVVLNFAHEMNGNWTPWGVGVNGNQPGEFITAWRHVHDVFTSVGTPNVQWMWTPNEMYEGVPATIEEVYPGDEYVDWYGMNGFNWGTAIFWESCDCRSAWRTFKEVFDGTYHRLVALGDKPIMIGEVGCAEQGGSKPDCISPAYLVRRPEDYPRIRAVAWFEKEATGLDTVEPGVVEPTTTAVNWAVTSSPESLEAYADAVALPYYQGSLRSIIEGSGS